MSEVPRRAIVENGSAPSVYRPDLIGPTLSEVDPSLLSSESSRTTIRWFHSPQEVDLFIWFDQRGELVKQQIAFWGAVVEWNLIDGIKTGVIVEDDSKKAYVASDLIQIDKEVSSGLLRQGLDLLRYIDSLDSQTRQKLVKNFTDWEHRDGLTQRELLNPLGGPSKAKGTGGTPSQILFTMVAWLKRIFTFFR